MKTSRIKKKAEEDQKEGRKKGGKKQTNENFTPGKKRLARDRVRIQFFLSFPCLLSFYLAKYHSISCGNSGHEMSWG